VKEILHAIIVRVRKPMDGKLRNRLSVFLICIVISVIMWGMIKLSREYQIPVRFRVVPENLPKGKVMIANPDSVISITMKAKGLELYSRIFSTRSNMVTISLENLRMKQEGDQYTGFLRTSKMLKSIAQQLPGGFEMSAVEPDTLHFVFEKSFRKKVGVRPWLSLDFSRQYQLYDSVRTDPDSVYISGRKDIIDTIRSIKTERRTFSNLKADASARLALLAPPVWPPVNLSADSVTVNLNVEKFTETSMEVPVSIRSGHSNFNYRTFPEKVTLTCKVALRDYNRVDPSLVTVVVDLDKSMVSDSERVPVEVSRVPAFLKIIRIEPQKVEYLILK
jgi:hypothetical protein